MKAIMKTKQKILNFLLRRLNSMILKFLDYEYTEGNNRCFFVFDTTNNQIREEICYISVENKLQKFIKTLK